MHLYSTCPTVSCLTYGKVPTKGRNYVGTRNLRFVCNNRYVKIKFTVNLSDCTILPATKRNLLSRNVHTFFVINLGTHKHLPSFQEDKICKISFFPLYIHAVYTSFKHKMHMHVSFARVLNFITCVIRPLLVKLCGHSPTKITSRYG